MRRVMVVFVLVGSLGFLSAAPTPKQPLTLPQKLTQRVKFNGIDDPRATLKDVLDQLSNLGDVTFDVNEKAFQMDNLQDVFKAEVAAPNPLPAMKNVRFSTILRKLLSRVPTESGATYLLREDHIEITTGAFQADEIWGQYTGPHLPLVNATLDKSTLEDAVKELSEQTEFNIVLDNRASEKAKTAVSARLRNAPLDSALRLLTNMADLRSVHLDNMLYVTTRENAAALEARLHKEQIPANPLDDQNAPPGLYSPRRGTGPKAVPPRNNQPGA
jgi:hypothetical protein